jgi:uncharacterized membrane protein YccC
MRLSLPKKPLESLVAWLDENDPARVDSARAEQLVVAAFLSCLVCVVLDAALRLNLGVRFPIVAGQAAATLMIVITPSNPRAERGPLLALSAASVGMVLLTAAIGPANHPYGDVVLKLVLVAVIAGGFYIRRFGPTWTAVGAAAMSILFLMAVLDPTTQAALWDAAAAAVGAAVVTVVRLNLFRAHAVDAVEPCLASYRSALAASLRAALRRIDPAQWAGTVEEAARRERAFRNVLAAAKAERPEWRARFDELHADVFRLQLALMHLQRITSAHHAGKTQSAYPEALRDLALMVAGDIEFADMDVSGSLASIHAEIVSARARLVSANPAGERPGVEPLLVLTALEMLWQGMLRLCNPPSPAAPVPRAPSRPAAPARMLPSTRVAIQALVASGITTMLDLTLHLNHAFWATLSVMMVLGTAYGDTVARVRLRTIGTVEGVVVGIVATTVLAGHVWLLATLAIAAEALAIVTLRRGQLMMSAGLGFGVVVGLHLLLDVDVASMFARSYQAVIGGVVTLAVARLVLPIYSDDPVRADATAFLARCRAMAASLWPAAPAPAAVGADVQALDAALSRLTGELPTLNAEALLQRRRPAELNDLASMLTAMTTLLMLWRDVAYRLAATRPGDAVRDVAAGCQGRVLAAFEAFTGAQPTPDETAQGDSARLPAADGDVELTLVEYRYLCDALIATLPRLTQLLEGALQSQPAPEPRMRASGGVRAAA